MKSVKKLLGAFTIFFVSVSNFQAQNLCKKTSVYFDLNNADLSVSANKKIDSLCKSLTREGYAIELYGYSDSLATFDYNAKLSQQRISAVRAQIDSKISATLRFFEKNLGEEEDASTSIDLALNRRVDIYVIPMKDNKIVIDNSKESIELPLDYFEPCGICASKPQLKAYFTVAEANPDMIRFETVDGGKLITAGTVKLDYNSCGNKLKPTSPVTFRVPTESFDPEMTVWEADTINGFIVWKNTEIQPIFDSLTQEYVISGASNIYNIDKPKWGCFAPDGPGNLIIYPPVFSNLTSKLVLDNVKQHSSDDTMHVYSEITENHSTISFGKTTNDSFFFLNRNLDPFLIRIDSNQKTFYISQTYNIPLSAYTEFLYSDTLMRVQCKKNTTIDNVGYYIAECNVFVPIDESLFAGYVEGNKPMENMQLSILKKGKLYSASYHKLKIRKYSGKKYIKIKLTNKNLYHFQLDNRYVPDEQN